MSHNNHTTSCSNKDAKITRERYLEMTRGFKSSFPLPVVWEFNGFNVIQEELIWVGSKCRFWELLMSTIQEDTIVYVQPRFGFAGISLTWLCKEYGKKLVLFMPSSKEVSDHQAYCIENWATPEFWRIAAMPNLNNIALWWSVWKNAFFIPLGLKHELVTAMIVRTCQDLLDAWVNPKRMWCAMSTWVLSRGLQIGFPDCEFFGVAVARNLKDGEKGKAIVYSHKAPFEKSIEKEIQAPFDSCSNYDLKCWQIMNELGKPGDFMWNVAGNIGPTKEFDKSQIKSYRDWL